MKILNRLPYHETPTLLSFREGAIEIRAYQIIVWVSLGKLVFPAVLDTGHSHNFSIPGRLLESWAGVESLEPIGEIEVNRQVLTQYRSRVQIYRNYPGRREPTDVTYVLEMDQGITVIPDHVPSAPRLPLLGLRSLTRNRLKLTIDGARREVSIRTMGWFA